MSGTRRRCAALALTVLATGACSGDEGSTADGAAPSSAAPPAAAPPPGSTWHVLGAGRFATPPEWERVPDAGPLPSGADAQLAVRAPAAEGEPAPVALALLDATPTRGAAAEAEALTTITRDVQRADDVRSERLELPGFSAAVLVSFEREAAGTGRVRSEVLVGDLADGTLWTLTVMAPPAAFAADDLTTVTRTVTTAAAD